MKHIVFSVLIFFYIPIFSQEKEKSPNELSNVESFSLKSGSMIQKEFIPIGSAKRITIEKLVVTDLLSKNKISGVRIQVPVAKSYSTIKRSGFIDFDEMEELVKSANFILQLNAPGENYTEFLFTSRGGFKAGSYSYKKDWIYFIQLNSEKESLISMNKPDFEKFISILQTVK